MLTKEEIQQLGDLIDTKLDQKLEPINKKLEILTSEVSHIKTAIKVLATKEDVEIAVDTAKAEIQVGIINLGSKMRNQARKAQEQDTRLENLEEHTSTHNPTRN